MITFHRHLQVLLKSGLLGLLISSLSWGAVSNTASFTGKNPDGSAITGTLTSNTTSTKVLPLITSALTDTVTTNIAYNYSITAQSNPTSGTLSYDATNLPTGLAINKTSGLISGTVTSTAGSPVSVTIKAINTDGTTMATLKLTIVNAPKPNIVLTKTATPASVKSGDTITYTITYQNTGTGDASNVVVTDVLPAGTTFLGSLSGTGCSQAAGTVTCNVGAVAAGAQAQTISFTATAQ